MCTELATVLKSEFDPQGYQIRNTPIPYWKLYLASFFNTDAGVMITRWRLQSEIDNTRSRDVLGLKYGEINHSILDMAYNMFETGALEDKRKIPGRARLWRTGLNQLQTERINTPQISNLYHKYFK